MSETFLLSIVGASVVPSCSGIIWLIRGQIQAAKAQARIELKVDTMWAWFTNHGSDITGYKEQP